jgi:regulator of protease activity HflC (stomatin/prohibitin superfamily)
VVYFRVVNPEDAVVKVADYIRATALIAQTTLRNVIGQSDLDDLLSRREQVNQRLQQMIDEATEPWGVKVTAVEVRDVNLAPEMIRAIARQAEAERERRAKVINAEGEFQAAQRLSEAAIVMAQNPISVQLRFLQTLSEISTERNSTVVFPIPIDLLSIFYDRARAMAGPQAPAAGSQSPPATAPDG